MQLFSFSIFSDRYSLKMENESNNWKTLATEVSYIALDLRELSLYRNSHWLARITLTGTNIPGFKPVWTDEVLLYFVLLYVYRSCSLVFLSSL